MNAILFFRFFNSIDCEQKLIFQDIKNAVGAITLPLVMSLHQQHLFESTSTNNLNQFLLT